MYAKTSIIASQTYAENKMWLNGYEVNLLKSERVNRCIEAGLCYHTFSYNICFSERFELK